MKRKEFKKIITEIETIIENESFPTLDLYGSNLHVDCEYEIPLSELMLVVDYNVTEYFTTGGGIDEPEWSESKGTDCYVEKFYIMKESCDKIELEDNQYNKIHEILIKAIKRYYDNN